MIFSIYKRKTILWVLPLLLGMSYDILAQKNVSSFVNLFIGTSGDNGQVDPGAGVPFGMVRVCPDSNPRSHAGYDFSVEHVSGISVNRLSGVGCGGAGGNLSLKPSTPEFNLLINKQSEKARPGYYETSFNNGVKAELTATHNIAVERFSFPKGEDAIITINPKASFERFFDGQHRIVTFNEIEGYIEAANVCGRGKYKIFFNLITDRPFTVKYDDGQHLVLSFAQDVKTGQVEIRIALSSVSEIAARKENLLKQSVSFARLKSDAGRLWEEMLSKIQVKGTDENKTIFYTSLYRVYLSPANVTSADGQYMASNGEIMNAEGFNYHSSWSLWDTYRTKFPLLVLVEPDVMSDIAQSLVRLYQTGKKNWTTDFEATPSVRTEHSAILLLDAYQKGIRGIDFKACYQKMCIEAEELSVNSPDQKLEAVCDLWALAQIAAIIGEDKDARKYGARSEKLFEETWRSEFMKIDSTFSQTRGNGLYQGTRWQYRWAVPQYIDKMIDWVGGLDVLKSQLSHFFDNHLYNHGNEPDIHVPYIFNRVGTPEETHRTVHAILNENMIHKYGGNAEFKTPYFGRAYKNSPDGFMPEMDEDDGTMGAWYVFSAMGLYPLVVGEPVYEITSPLLNSVCIKLGNGRLFTIKTRNRKNIKDKVLQVLFNGKPYNAWQLSHIKVLEGGTLEFIY